MMTGTPAIPAPIRPPAELPLAFLDQVALWGQAYLPVLLDKFHIPPADVAVQLRHPHVKALLRERQDYWRQSASPEERIKAKARMAVEDAIPRMQEWLEDEEVHISSKLAIVKELRDLASLPKPAEAQVSGGAGLILNVDFGEGKRVTVDSNPVLEGDSRAIVSDEST